MIFDHDWWFGGAFERQKQCAIRRCAQARQGDDPALPVAPDSDAARFMTELETRTVIYLRDGFSYELRCPLDMGTTAYLSFECVPVEDAYKVGAFVLAVPFEEICRVETFAVHPEERPEEAQAIKGFSGGRGPMGGRGEDRNLREIESPA